MPLDSYWYVGDRLATGGAQSVLSQTIDKQYTTSVSSGQARSLARACT